MGIVKRVKNVLKSTPLVAIPIVVVVLVVTSALNVYINKVDGDYLLEFKESVENHRTEEEWNNISSMLIASQVAASQNSKYIAQRLELDLYKMFGNFGSFKEYFEKSDFDEKFLDLVTYTLNEETNIPSTLYPINYHTMLAIDKGIIASFSNTDKLITHEIEEVITWENFIKNIPNPELAAEALQSIRNKDNNIIFMQTEPSRDGEIEKNTNMDLETLKSAFFKYGLDGLKYYSLLSPAYITEKGEIYSIEDAHRIAKTDNYKIMIIQSFNLSDIISKFERSILEHQKNTVQDLTFLYDYVKNKNLRALIWSFALFSIGILLINIYNSTLRNHEDEIVKLTNNDYNDFKDD